MGESHVGGRTATNVRSPASNDSPLPTQRWRSIGSSISPAIRSLANQLVTSVAFGHMLEHQVEVAGVVGVVVGEEDPLHVLRLDEAEDLLGPRLAQQLGVGVDDHRLGALDHERVDVHGDGRAGRLAERPDEVRALGDAQGVREGDRHLHVAVHGPLRPWAGHVGAERP